VPLSEKRMDTVGEVGGTPLGACILGPSARARRPHAARLPLDRASSPTASGCFTDGRANSQTQQSVM